jgi:glycosyltransferase involved in cell wall biosynthesis
MKVSILLPLYGRTGYLSEAIESVLAQDFQDWELIIISDPPLTAEAREIISHYLQKDKRIIFFENKNKLGFPASLNLGMKMAKGEYIARIDDDDIWFDFRKLRKQIEFFEKNKEYGVVGGGAIVIDEKGRELYCFLEPETDEEIRNYILFRNPFLHSSVVFKKEIAKKAGGYNEKVPGSCDYDLWLRMGRFVKFYNLPDYLIKFRLPTSYRDKKSVRLQRIQRTLEKIEIIKQYRKEYPHFFRAILKDYLKIFYLLTLARCSKLDDYLYKKRQVSIWRI